MAMQCNPTDSSKIALLLMTYIIFFPATDLKCLINSSSSVFSLVTFQPLVRFWGWEMPDGSILATPLEPEFFMGA